MNHHGICNERYCPDHWSTISYIRVNPEVMDATVPSYLPIGHRISSSTIQMR